MMYYTEKIKLIVLCNSGCGFDEVYKTGDLKSAFEFAMDSAMPGDQYEVVSEGDIVARSGDDMGQALDELIAHYGFLILNGHRVENAVDEGRVLDDYLVDGKRYNLAEDALQAIYGWDKKPGYWKLG